MQAGEIVKFITNRIKVGYFLVASMARSLLETVKDIEREAVPLAYTEQYEGLERELNP